MKTLSRDQVRRVDLLAIERYGIPGVVLRKMPAAPPPNKSARCSSPNCLFRRNARASRCSAAAGITAATATSSPAIHNSGCAVTLFAASDPAKLSGDAKLNYTITARMSLLTRSIATPELLRALDREAELVSADLLVDALLGTGFRSDVRGELAAVIEACNALHARGKKVIAIDVPSGLDCDTGAPSNAMIRADLTVTFVALKRGFASPAAAPYLGRVTGRTSARRGN